MHIVVNEELKAYIDPLTPDEYEALERSLLAEGCRDALVLWGDTLVDGHNRYGICRKHDIPFQTVQNERFQSLDDVHLWMIEQHLGRRSVSDFQRGVLALRKREILAERRARAAATEGGEAAPDVPFDTTGAQPAASKPARPAATESRKEIAREARISSNQVGMIEKIRKEAAPEVVAAVKSGTLSISAAAAVASLPEEEQKAAASAGDAELKEAAKRVRESKRKPREKPTDEVKALREQVAELEAENRNLRREIDALRARLGEATPDDADEALAE
ncbi:plasmid replication/partition related protein [Luteibacter jiangsuensis]|uniref:Plasmid replication/partition related protein n=1 Tax=Luteibacter jiangsuensis TaxID=637577 RepID=A0ABX0Q1E4_9GAMM|nr:plasmid replication/partition related protein [Luteibacter jiangsuensis]NID04260.1 plasmid replication/partition related protein [Luteibacter jiangsuensis]